MNRLLVAAATGLLALSLSACGDKDAKPADEHAVKAEDAAKTEAPAEQTAPAEGHEAEGH
jgi:hypothetical protein